MGKLEVIDGGLFTTIQDAGRPGFRKYGVPVSGAMDSKSYELANWLVGNPKGSPTLECTLKGGKYRFLNQALIAITGATMQVLLNSKEIPMNHSRIINKGDILELGFSSRGCRSYLAIKGIFALEKVMSSFSTYTLGKFGGLNGHALKVGDELEWETKVTDLDEKEAPKNHIPYFSSKLTVRIMKSPEWEWFSESAQKKFLTTQFTVSNESNRMGIRLGGSKIKFPDRQMISGPVIPGIIQLPSNGNPIILMQDGQTIGGYPRIAKVLDEDLWRLGQVKAGDKVGFSLT